MSWQPAEQTLAPVSRSWTTRRDEKQRRLQLIKPWMDGPIIPREKIIEVLETLLVSGDRIVLEGDNQKQADFLSRSLVKIDPNTGRALRSAAAISQDLASNIAYDVRWYDATTVLLELGCSLFLEMPPGHVLSELARQTFPDIKTLAVGESSFRYARDLAGEFRA